MLRDAIAFAASKHSLGFDAGVEGRGLLEFRRDLFQDMPIRVANENANIPQVGKAVRDGLKARHEEVTDGNETIDRGETLAALFDYFSGAITQDEVIEIIRLYFAG